MLIKINLLDWRAELREKRKKQFQTLALGVAVAAAGVVGLSLLAMNRAIDNQNERNQMLKVEIALIEKQIKEIEELEKTRANLLARMQVIEQLQQSRAQTVHYFDEVVNTIPEGVYLTALKQDGKKTKIDGIAESNGRVSAYMKNLDASAYFADPKLVVIKTAAKGTGRVSSFTLEVTETNPTARPDDQGAGAVAP